jgi:hypothetical protein
MEERSNRRTVHPSFCTIQWSKATSIAQTKGPLLDIYYHHGSTASINHGMSAFSCQPRPSLYGKHETSTVVKDSSLIDQQQQQQQQQQE